MPERPEKIDYYLGQAIAIAARAECTGQRVGAVIVGEGNRILSTGYNGTPDDVPNCKPGGVCHRCNDSSPFGGTGNGYDKCICVHAEMNAIATAARYGIALDGATAYVTHQPCLTCSKELIQAGIRRAYYAIELAPPVDGAGQPSPELRAVQDRLTVALNATHVPDAGERAAQGIEQAVANFKSQRSRATSHDRTEAA